MRNGSRTKQETVARRIVMPAETWDQLVHLAEALRETRNVEVGPTDVALIALEAGLEEVRQGHPARGSARSTKNGSREGAHRGNGKNGNGEAPPRKGKNGSGARPRNGKNDSGGSGRSRRPAKELALSGDERAELDATVGGVRSVRGRQRSLALWLGLRRKKIEVEHLRKLATDYGAYDVANFAQNMKKDGALFKEVQEQGARAGWRLTAAGKRDAESLLRGALQTA